MNRVTGIMVILALAAGLAFNAEAKRERKEQPKQRFVEETLAELGGEHNPEKMKVKKVASIEVGDTYFHVFEGKLPNGLYHVIVFDNYQNYLGFYQSNFPPTNYQIDNSIVIDPQDIDDSGNPLYYPIPIDPEKGIPKKVTVGGVPTELVPGPEIEKPEAEADETAGPKPEFRVWTIKHKGTPQKVRALYISKTFSEVTLQGETTGIIKAFPITDLSKEDREYVQQFDF